MAKYEYTQFSRDDEAWGNMIMAEDVERPDHQAPLRRLNELANQGWVLQFVTPISQGVGERVDVLYTLYRVLEGVSINESWPFGSSALGK